MVSYIATPHIPNSQATSQKLLLNDLNCIKFVISAVYSVMTNRKREQKMGTGTKKMIEKCRSVANIQQRIPCRRDLKREGRKIRTRRKKKKKITKGSVFAREKKVNGSKCSSVWQEQKQE